MVYSFDIFLGCKYIVNFFIGYLYGLLMNFSFYYDFIVCCEYKC